jgi:hypothetical protein
MDERMEPEPYEDREKPEDIVAERERRLQNAKRTTKVHSNEEGV